MALLLAEALLATKPTPSAAVTITASSDWKTAGTIAQSASIPDGSTVFDDEEEVLDSIVTTGTNSWLCSLSMNSYTTGWVCGEDSNVNSGSQYTNLEGDPLLELRGCARNGIVGFATKHDSGIVRVWGYQHYQ